MGKEKLRIPVIDGDIQEVLRRLDNELGRRGVPTMQRRLAVEHERAHAMVLPSVVVGFEVKTRKKGGWRCMTLVEGVTGGQMAEILLGPSSIGQMIGESDREMLVELLGYEEARRRLKWVAGSGRP